MTGRNKGMSRHLPGSAAGLVLRLLAMLGLGGLCAGLLAARLAEVEAAALWQSLAAMHPVRVILALALSAISLAAAGRYDAVLHRHLQTGIPGDEARRAGIAAIAVSQMLGLGVISGAILRWRMLPTLDLRQAAALTAAVAGSFLAAWAVLTAAVVALSPGAAGKGWAALVLLVAFGLAALSLMAPRGRFAPRRWPNALTLGRLLGLCAVDMLAAAAALAVLLPGASIVALLPAFLLAFGAGLLAATPGGMGAFEVTLLALMPGVAPTELLAAVLVWRLVYHALPALGGAVLAIRGPGAGLDSHRATNVPANAPYTGRAELGLAAQGEHRWLAAGAGAAWLAGRSPHLLIGLLAPAGRTEPAQALTALARAAAAEERRPAVYKADARLACAARRLHWQTLRIASEAVIAPQQWQLSTPACAGLRRKLRKATAAGVSLAPAAAPGARLPWAALDRIAADWARAHRGERGFSMGRYTRGYLSGQRVYLACQSGQVIAFASFHQRRHEWVLDLMRHGAGVPDGTMQALVARAIEDARALGLPRLSLAAVPALRPRGWLMGRFRAHGDGLARFKSAFAPRWEPRYLLAPDRASLALACAEIARAVHAPPPLAPQRIDDHHAENEFATIPAPWQEEAKPQRTEGGSCPSINSHSSCPAATG